VGRKRGGVGRKRGGVGRKRGGVGRKRGGALATGGTRATGGCPDLEVRDPGQGFSAMGLLVALVVVA
jgi:hypothetical protein